MGLHLIQIERGHNPRSEAMAYNAQGYSSVRSGRKPNVKSDMGRARRAVDTSTGEFIQRELQGRQAVRLERRQPTRERQQDLASVVWVKNSGYTKRVHEERQTGLRLLPLQLPAAR